jgi:hypothetical protein
VPVFWTGASAFWTPSTIVLEIVTAYAPGWAPSSASKVLSLKTPEASVVPNAGLSPWACGANVTCAPSADQGCQSHQAAQPPPFRLKHDPLHRKSTMKPAATDLTAG